jgi:hypothetical protein
MTAPLAAGPPPEKRNPAPLGVAGTGLGNVIGLVAGDEGKDSPDSRPVQAATAELQREYAVEALLIAAVKASHAADDLVILDDFSAERQIKVAITHLREGAAAFREMQAALASLGGAAR